MLDLFPLLGEDGCELSQLLQLSGRLHNSHPFPYPLKVADFPDEIWNLILSPDHWFHKTCWGAVRPVPSEMSLCSLVPLIRNLVCLFKVLAFIEMVRFLSPLPTISLPQIHAKY